MNSQLWVDDILIFFPYRRPQKSISRSIQWLTIYFSTFLGLREFNPQICPDRLFAQVLRSLCISPMISCRMPCSLSSSILTREAAVSHEPEMDGWRTGPIFIYFYHFSGPVAPLAPRRNGPSPERNSPLLVSQLHHWIVFEAASSYGTPSYSLRLCKGVSKITTNSYQFALEVYEVHRLFPTCLWSSCGSCNVARFDSGDPWRACRGSRLGTVGARWSSKLASWDSVRQCQPELTWMVGSLLEFGGWFVSSVWKNR